MQLATETIASLVLRPLWLSGIFRWRLRHELEHFQHRWALPHLRPSVALDRVLELRRLVAAQRLVWRWIE